MIAERWHFADAGLSLAVPHAHDVVACTAGDEAARTEGGAECGGTHGASVALGGGREWGGLVAVMMVIVMVLVMLMVMVTMIMIAVTVPYH